MAGKARYTTRQFIDAIPGTGGVLSALAERVGCTWNTAKKYVHEYATVRQAWEDERGAITDTAKSNIIKSIQAGDLAMSKWWLQVMDAEFVPKERHEMTGAEGGPLVIAIGGVDPEEDI